MFFHQPGKTYNFCWGPPPPPSQPPAFRAASCTSPVRSGQPLSVARVCWCTRATPVSMIMACSTCRPLPCPLRIRCFPPPCAFRFFFWPPTKTPGVSESENGWSTTKRRLVMDPFLKGHGDSRHNNRRMCNSHRFPLKPTGKNQTYSSAAFQQNASQA